ncbi:hypothetical protein Hanom_Chr08g00738671 [Helianthus anomalus]
MKNQPHLIRNSIGITLHIRRRRRSRRPNRRRNSGRTRLHNPQITRKRPKRTRYKPITTTTIPLLLINLPHHHTSKQHKTYPIHHQKP